MFPWKQRKQTEMIDLLWRSQASLKVRGKESLKKKKKIDVETQSNFVVIHLLIMFHVLHVLTSLKCTSICKLDHCQQYLDMHSHIPSSWVKQHLHKFIHSFTWNQNSLADDDEENRVFVFDVHYHITPLNVFGDVFMQAMMWCVL